MMQTAPDKELSVPKTIKVFLLVLFITPIFYGLGAAAINAIGYTGSYSDGRLLLAVSSCAAFAISQLLFRTSKNQQASADDK